MIGSNTVKNAVTWANSVANSKVPWNQTTQFKNIESKIHGRSPSTFAETKVDRWKAWMQTLVYGSDCSVRIKVETNGYAEAKALEQKVIKAVKHEAGKIFKTIEKAGFTVKPGSTLFSVTGNNYSTAEGFYFFKVEDVENKTATNAELKVGDSVEVVGKGLASKGWQGKIEKIGPGAKWNIVVKFPAGKYSNDSGEYSADEIAKNAVMTNAKYKVGDKVVIKYGKMKGKSGKIATIDKTENGDIYEIDFDSGVRGSGYLDDEFAKNSTEGNVVTENAVPVDDSFTPMSYIKVMIKTIKSNPSAKDLEGKAWKVVREKYNYKALQNTPEYKELDKMVGVNAEETKLLNAVSVTDANGKQIHEGDLVIWKGMSDKVAHEVKKLGGDSGQMEGYVRLTGWSRIQRGDSLIVVDKNKYEEPAAGSAHKIANSTACNDYYPNDKLHVKFDDEDGMWHVYGGIGRPQYNMLSSFKTKEEAKRYAEATAKSPLCQREITGVIVHNSTDYQTKKLVSMAYEASMNMPPEEFKKKYPNTFVYAVKKPEYKKRWQKELAAMGINADERNEAVACNASDKFSEASGKYRGVDGMYKIKKMILERINGITALIAMLQKAKGTDEEKNSLLDFDAEIRDAKADLAKLKIAAANIA